jgi:hypothetical protein
MEPTFSSAEHTRIAVMSWLLVFASVIMLCGTSLAQEAAVTLSDVSGEWTIDPVRDTTEHLGIDVTFDDTGALNDVIAPGFEGLIQGGAAVDKKELLITVLDVYTFKGKLNGNSDKATGQLIYDDLAGFERKEQAIARRIR